MKFIHSVIHPLLKLLPKEDKRKGFWIIVLLTINSALDFFNLASFLPLIYGVINPSVISSNRFLNRIYSEAGFKTVSTFLIGLTIGIVVFAILKNIISQWIIKQKAIFAFDLGSELSARALSHYLENSYLKFTQVDFSKELNRIANHPIAFANNIVMPIGTILSEGLLFTVLVICLIFYNSIAFVFLLIILIPIIVVFSFNRKKIRETSDDLKEKYPLSLKYALQSVEGFVEIKTYGKEAFFQKRYTALSQKLARTFTRDHIVSTGTSRLSEMAAICVIGSLIFYSIATQQNYQQTIILLSIYAGVSFRLVPCLNRILNSFQQIKKYEFLFSEMNASIQIENLPTTHSSRLTFDDKIELKNISFQYPGSSFALKNVSFTIHKGEKICLVGQSGSGKTTLLLILLRYLTEHTGQLMLDGKDLTEKDNDSWKKIFGYVSQNPYILDGTLTENIAFGITPAEVQTQKILDLIQYLGLTSMVEQLPNGLATHIGEKGVRLSGGQRQRIAIARALYADSEVLLLDEITNHLDPETKEEIMKTLVKVSEQGKTIIVISHHENPKLHFDKVFLLKDGRLQEEIIQSHLVK